ncbi:MAG: hypothetical protein PWP49_117 [Thermococcaceae archaeon]|jgi:hypothetical protein|uniref:hypothetical protein n=1 Tax=Thermococcus TaxID=2263 RepID=UPI0005B26E9E|nr:MULTISPECIES: hypothetical protein [Thermococcus]MDK2853878.1 hypothetical protein [Thermococcaceae archaeon]ALV63272.1 hypothetical protein ADU37_CDS15730 [Thermococcus sp. 2319x1]MCA6214031.1 hypothetical protein [Thermococcus bergensis]MDK2982923.1 hypothetical protein [Thermococcaceae archaeon]MDN5319697.1 hypothetical protein [Thermococcaceae archaeon]
METKFCEGIIVKGKSPQESCALHFWKAPWKRGFKGAISGAIRAYPWLCLNCGAIIPYVEEAELQKVKEEYEEAKLEGRL